MRLTQTELSERREKIIHNAFLLFCKYGIEAVTLTEIASQSNVGRSAIFRYFESKDKLVLEAFIELWDTIMSNEKSAVEQIKGYDDLSGYEQIRRWVEQFRDLDKKHDDFVLFSYEAKLYLLRHNIKLNREQQEAMMHAIREPCIAALDKGKADGSITAKDSSEDLFYTIWGAVRGYIVKIVIYGRLYGADSPWESRYMILEDAIMRSLCSDWSARGL